MRSDAATSNNTSVSILADTGLYVGADSDGHISVSGNDVRIDNDTQDGDIIMRVNDGGVVTTAITIDGATSVVTINTSATVTGNISGGNVTTTGVVTATGNISGGNVSVGTGSVSLGSIENNNSSGVGNIGSAGTTFNTVHALATSAQYADMAERFHADAEYSAGTVVELGGVNEITLCQDELSDTVFGVVSTKAAYLMNGGAGTNATHPPIAMTGRVPVNVMGFIAKGDRLVSAGNGFARAATLDEVTAFNVIGRALEGKTDEGLGSVEAIVKIA
tara:strand:- start:415 stop:1242 length:828 start_codon:yes stop_codon:yes gene_type:complete